MESFRNLKAGRPELVDDKLIYPLLRWSSGSLTDIQWCNEVNKYLFSVPPIIAKDFLSIGIKDRNPYIKYPKATKEKSDKSFELKKNLVEKYYGWSDQEFDRNTDVFSYIDWSEVAKSLGCDNKERKLLGLDKIIATRSKRKSATKSLFDF